MQWHSLFSESSVKSCVNENPHRQRMFLNTLMNKVKIGFFKRGFTIISFTDSGIERVVA